MSGSASDRGRGRGRGRGDQSIPFHHRGDGTGAQRSFGGGRGGRGRGREASVEVEVFRHNDGQSLSPDKEVQRVENTCASRVKTKQSSDKHPQRPGFGAVGKEVTLWTNYFNLHTNNSPELYRYSVTIAPDNKGKAPAGKRCRRIVQLLLEEHFSSQKHEIATDFKSNLISARKLTLENDEFVVFYRLEEEEDTAPPNAAQHRCRVQFTGSLSLSELVNHLTSTQMGSMLASKEEIIQALNIVLGHRAKGDPSIASLASNRHFATKPENRDRMSLGAGLQVVRGFFMSVRAATARILVNVQVKNMAFYDDGPLDNIMADFMSANGPNKVNLLNFVKRLSIDATHILKKNSQGQRIRRIKTVQGFATRDDGRNMAHPPIVSNFGGGAKEVQFYLEESLAASSSTTASVAGGRGKKGKKAVKEGPAPSSSGRYITVFDFFKETYNIVIKNPALPVINVAGRDSPSYLPAEVCIVQPGQPAAVKLSGAQTQQMIRFAVRRPVHNAQSIVTSGGRLLGFEATNPTLRAFGMDIPPKLVTVPGRVLDNPAIRYSGNAVTMPRFGSWNMQNVKFIAQADLPSWTYFRISLHDARNAWPTDQDFTAKLDELQQKLKELGVSLNKYMSGVHVTSNVQGIEGAIDHWMHRFAINPRRPKLILVIIPEPAATAVYNRVKYACDIKEGILNICVIDSKFSRASPQYLANVGLKFNMKLGGRNHSIDAPKLGFVAQKKTMVVGIDVTHPSPGSSSNAPSVAAIVASVDEWLAQWPGDIRIQPARQEMVADVGAMLTSRLLLWRERSRALPENILVYRDGVSEGQYNKVLDEELPALRAACEVLYPASDTKAGRPYITLVIVGKRHNTRFYPTMKEDADRGGNPMNGTIVDRGITEARNWDFFLQAHAAIQGTTRPAHYYVIYDRIFCNLKLPAKFPTAADALEDLTHNMCYLFGRATKAVSICPPAYYADLLCERARCYLSALFDPSPPSSPTASSFGTGTAATTPSAETSMVTIHPTVKSTMFYI